MSCGKDHAEFVRLMMPATQLGRGQPDAAPRCRNEKCNLPLKKDGTCPRGCRQEDAPPAEQRVAVLSGDQQTLLGLGTLLGTATVYFLRMPDGTLSSLPNAEERPAVIPEGAELIIEENNPKIRLDNGRVVYGCQVWWTTADRQGELEAQMQAVAEQAGSPWAGTRMLLDDVLPGGYYLIQALPHAQDTRWQPGDYVLMRELTTEPTFRWHGRPIADQTEGMTDEEMNTMAEDDPRWQSFWAHHAHVDASMAGFAVDPMVGHQFVEACRQAGYDPERDGYHVVSWFVDQVARKLDAAGHTEPAVEPGAAQPTPEPAAADLSGELSRAQDMLSQSQAALARWKEAHQDAMARIRELTQEREAARQEAEHAVQTLVAQRSRAAARELGRVGPAPDVLEPLEVEEQGQRMLAQVENLVVGLETEAHQVEAADPTRARRIRERAASLRATGRSLAGNLETVLGGLYQRDVRAEALWHTAQEQVVTARGVGKGSDEAEPGLVAANQLLAERPPDIFDDSAKFADRVVAAWARHEISAPHLVDIIAQLHRAASAGSGVEHDADGEVAK